jgi:hypothetical protein
VATNSPRQHHPADKLNAAARRLEARPQYLQKIARSLARGLWPGMPACLYRKDTALGHSPNRTPMIWLSPGITPVSFRCVSAHGAGWRHQDELGELQGPIGRQ